MGSQDYLATENNSGILFFQGRYCCVVFYHLQNRKRQIKQERKKMIINR